MLNRGLDKQELLRIVEAVANEKSIDKELVIGSMESAIQKAALTKFGLVPIIKQIRFFIFILIFYFKKYNYKKNITQSKFYQIIYTYLIAK